MKWIDGAQHDRVPPPTISACVIIIIIITTAVYNILNNRSGR